MAAAQIAVEHAGLEIAEREADRIGVYVGAVSVLRPAFWSAFDPTARVLPILPLSALVLGVLCVAGLAWVVGVYDALLTARRPAA